MKSIEKLKARLKTTDNNLKLHSLFLVIIPILLILTINELENNHLYRSIAENQLIWISAYFVLSVSLALVLKVYNVLDSALFVICMLGSNFILWIILSAIVGKFVIVMYPVAIIATGILFNFTLRSFKFNGLLTEFRNTLDTDPSLLNEYVGTKSEIEHSLNFDEIDSTFVGESLSQDSRNGRQTIAIDGYYLVEENKFFLAQKRLQQHIIRISPNTVDSVSISSGKNSLFLDNEQLLKGIERIIKAK